MLLKVLLGLLVLFLFGLAATPTIVAKTGLRNRIVRQATVDLNGTLDIGNASLGWFSPIELRDVTLTDIHGQVVARIPKVTSSKSLLGLIRDHAIIGEATLHNPSVEMICEKNSSNLEELLQKYLEMADPLRSPVRPELTVRVIGGTLSLRRAGEALAGEFRELDATISIPSSRTEAVTAQVSGAAPQRFDADILAGDSGRVKLTTHGTALELLSPLLRRLDVGLALSGSLTADLTATWGKNAFAVEGNLGGKKLSVAAPWLKGDTLHLSSVSIPLKVGVTGNVVRIERADFTSDAGSLSVTGEFDSSEPSERILSQPGLLLGADIDLAKLAATIPKVLRIRDGTELREGKLRIHVESRSAAEGTTWAGKVGTSSLKGTREGREVKWEEPLSIEFAGQYRPGQLPTFDKLICRSDFVAVQAEVKADSVRAAANVYLDRLALRLTDFINLDGATLEGRGTLSFVAQRAQDQTFKAEGLLELKQFAFIDHNGNGLREPSLTLRVSASGNAPVGAPVMISTGTATIMAGADELQLTLVEPITNARQPSSGKLDAQLTGDLARWWARVGSVVRLPKHYVLGGAATARGSIRFEESSITIDRLSLTLVNARFRGAGLDVEEEHMDARTDLTINRKAGTTTFDKFTVHSAPLSVTNGRLTIETPEIGPVIVDGEGPVIIGLAHLGKTLKVFDDPRGPESVHGRGSGPIRFRYSGDVTSFGGSLDIITLAIGQPSAPDWTEPALRLEANGTYTESSDSLALTIARIERPGLALDAIVSLGKLGTSSDLKLDGTLAYDLAKLTPKLRDALGGGFAAQGKGSTPITLSGSFSPSSRAAAKSPPGTLAAMNGAFRIGWKSLNAYGFDVGNSELNAQLVNGVCRTNPITATFGGGKVNMQPTIHFDRAPGFVTFANGKVVKRARLTPAVCADALGYALPAIARSSKAEGEISVVLNENRVPFESMNKALAKGQITIHKATVAPGPVVGEIAKLLGATNVAMTVATDTVVPIRIENGRVHHQNFAMLVGGHTVITSGSVGFDGKLSLIADVPVPAGLLKNAPLASKALANKRVRVPIAGSLSRPAIDQRQFQTAIAQLAQESGRDLGKDLLNKELQKLFPSVAGPKK